MVFHIVQHVHDYDSNNDKADCESHYHFTYYYHALDPKLNDLIERNKLPNCSINHIE